MRLSIDPGLGGTGWALWKERDWAEARPPARCGVLTPAAKDWLEASADLAAQLTGFLAQYQVTVLYCEQPAFFDSPTGQAAAKRGDLLKLTFVTGRFAEVARTAGVDFVPVPVNLWKGQMPKEAVIRRILNRLGVRELTQAHSHAWDAIGIGMYAKGVF